MDLKVRDDFVQDVVRMLADGEYKKLETISSGSRLSAEDMEMAVAEYQCKVVAMPAEAVHLVDYTELNDRTGWSVVVPIFTKEKGRSDLSLELTLTRNLFGSYELEIDNLHTL